VGAVKLWPRQLLAVEEAASAGLLVLYVSVSFRKIYFCTVIQFHVKKCQICGAGVKILPYLIKKINSRYNGGKLLVNSSVNVGKCWKIPLAVVECIQYPLPL
jgi:hypothetical protein